MLDILFNPFLYIVLTILFIILGCFFRWKLHTNETEKNRGQALIKRVDKEIKKVKKNDTGATIYKYEVEIFYRGSKCTANAESSFFYDVGDYVQYRIINKRIVFDNIAEEEENANVHRRHWPYKISFASALVSIMVFFVMKLGFEQALAYLIPVFGLVAIIACIVVRFHAHHKLNKSIQQKIDNGTIVIIKGEVLCFDQSQTVYSSNGKSRCKVFIKYTTPDGEEKVDKQNFYIDASWPHDIGDVIDLQYDKSIDEAFLIEEKKTNNNR